MKFSKSLLKRTVSFVAVFLLLLGVLPTYAQEEAAWSNKTPVTEPISAMPTGTQNDGLVQIESLKGLSVTQSVQNGDFRNGTENWRTKWGSASAEDNIVTVTGDGTDPTVQMRQPLYVSPDVGDKYYIYSKVRVTNDQAIGTRFFLRNGDGGTVFSNSANTAVVANKWYENSAIVTIKEPCNRLVLHIDSHYSSGQSAGQSMEIDGNAGVFAINMTELGIEDYTEDQMKQIVKTGYWEGIKSVVNPTINTVSQNLYNINGNISDDGKSVNPNLLNNLDYPTSKHGNRIEVGNWSSSHHGLGQVIEVKPNTTYTAQLTVPSSNIETIVMGIHTSNGLNRLITRVLPGSDGSLTYTTSSNEDKVFLSIELSSNSYVPNQYVENIMLHEGDTPQPYTTYDSDKMTMQDELRSLPNGIADEVIWC